MLMSLTGLTILLIAVGPRAEALAPQRDEKCFDLAVVAEPPRETVIAGTSDPDDLIGHPAWRLDISVDRVLLGSEKRKRIDTLVVKHGRYNPAIKRWLFLLRSRADGSYDDAGGDYRVIADRNGELVIPFTEPASDDWLFPAGPLPHSYKALLKPVNYAPHQTWWLREVDEADTEVLDPAWAVRRGGYVVARRGIFLSDWAQAMKHEPGAFCPKP